MEIYFIKAKPCNILFPFLKNVLWGLRVFSILKLAQGKLCILNEPFLTIKRDAHH